ncbi:TetR-like C-terminal domain-containing protein [Isoptericola cucumis]|uniref:TetR-like C-terminal domain-containing protein n=1 Tax=Isoptericola cucumis TaxID=1776856 RepID=UPI00320940C0
MVRSSGDARSRSRAPAPPPELGRGVVATAETSAEDTQGSELRADPQYRALLAAVFGARFTHPQLMAAFWDNHILPRRRTALVVLARAAHEGHIPPGTDIEALLDMTVGALLYRLLQPGDLPSEVLLDYLRRLYRQAGVLPARDAR